MKNRDRKETIRRIPPDRLYRIIRQKIRRDGPMTFAAFMEAALYYPGLGYYMRPKTTIGPAGDYYTSPHLHGIFGRLLAVQLDELKGILDTDESFTILEVGAGRGYLAEDIIGYIQDRLSWNDTWRYIIVEKNPHAVEAQKRLLNDFADRIVWKASLEAIDCFSGCVVANEVLDAFPVHRIEMSDRFQEVYIGNGKTGFTETLGDLSRPELSAYIRDYGLPHLRGYRTEINLGIFDYLNRLNRILSEGFIISIDYGYPASQYYSAERHRGTLLCYAKHRIQKDPYRHVGDQDITAHVNFTSVKNRGDACGIRTIGYCPQGPFLASLGIDSIVSEALEADGNFHKELPKIKNLLFETGESHHVMIQYKGKREVPPLKGFSLNNRMSRL